MRTLHTYFGRELLKTFLMTAAALSLLIIMGGGVGNMFSAEGVGASELARIFVYLTPIAITLILPVAALFSATITYGRAAIDNEILACRAAGVNIHRLLMPPFALGLTVTILTFISWNFMIPYMWGSIYRITRMDLPTIVMKQLQKARPLKFRNFVITANQCETIPVDQLPPEFQQDHSFLQLVGVTFLQIDDQELMEVGTADATVIMFDHSKGTPQVKVDMQEVRSFDASHYTYHQLEHQLMGPFEIPLPLSRKIKFENLDTLLAFKEEPRKIPEIIDMLHGMRREMKTFFLNQDLEQKMQQQDPVYRLKGTDFDLEITAVNYATDQEDGRTRLREVKVRQIPNDGKPTTVYQADEASIEISKGMQPDSVVIVVELLANVRITQDPPGANDSIVKKPKLSLPGVRYDDQETLRKTYEAFDITTLFRRTVDIPLFHKQERMRGKIATKVRQFASQVRGEIQFRSSYSLGAIAIVVLGAILGIIVRGGQVLTAFGISCVPMLFVIIASIVGRNLADHPDYTRESILIMWGATALMYAATVFVGMRILKR